MTFEPDLPQTETESGVGTGRRWRLSSFQLGQVQAQGLAVAQDRGVVPVLVLALGPEVVRARAVDPDQGVVRVAGQVVARDRGVDPDLRLVPGLEAAQVVDLVKELDPARVLGPEAQTKPSLLQECGRQQMR